MRPPHAPHPILLRSENLKLAFIPGGRPPDKNLRLAVSPGAWLATHSQPSLYAGRVFWDSQVIRSNFSKADLRHPEWFPPDFAKWAVPYDAFASASGSYPPYCSGGGYLLGSAAAQMVVKRHDARRGAARPIVRVEDAYVGILAAESRLQPTDMAELVQDPPVGRAQGRELFERQAS